MAGCDFFNQPPHTDTTVRPTIAVLPGADVNTIDPNDPYARTAQIFPRLDESMIDTARHYGVEQDFQADTLLYARGERAVCFFVIVAGTVEVFDLDASGQPVVFATHTHGQFTGELDLLNQREVLVYARAGPGTRVIKIERDALKRMLAAEPDIAEIVMRALILRRVGLIQNGTGGVLIVGGAHDAATLALQRFLTRNGYPHRLVDTTDAGAEDQVLEGMGMTAERLPVVIFPDQTALSRPSTAELADRLGLTEAFDGSLVYDVVVVGAGPSGLAAAVYAASEGLNTIVIEGLAPGGQAGTSSRIENYLGFPTGISGQALAGRAHIQAQKFGARLAISRFVRSLECDEHPFRLELEDGEEVRTHAIVVATGARYRKLSAVNYERFEGSGVHYAATPMEGKLCQGQEVIVVGGGNSAGQAAVFLSRTASMVHLLVRADGLAATMSNYLIERITHSARITLHVQSEIVRLDGDDHLETVACRHRDTGEVVVHPVGNVFVMIGADPNTDWLGDCVGIDAKGFVETGRACAGVPATSPYATSRPGIFAVGDVRSGSVKRVASGVGEGSAVIQAVHEYLASIRHDSMPAAVPASPTVMA